MGIRSRFLILIFGIVGFVVIPASIFTFFSFKKITKPNFYTKALIKSDFAINYIQDNLSENKKIPRALKQNLDLAKKDIDRTIKNYLFPQIETQIKMFIDYLKGSGKFPPFEFELLLFKKNLINDFKEAADKQKFTDKIFIKFTMNFFKSFPSIFDLKKKVNFEPVKEFVNKNRKYINMFFKYNIYLWGIPFVFLLLFFISTLSIRYSLYYFSKLLLFSGGFFFIVFSILYLFPSFILVKIQPFILDKLNFLIYLPVATVFSTEKYILKTFSFQGIISAVIIIVLGILLSSNKKERKNQQEVIVQHQFVAPQQPVIPHQPQY